MNFHHDAPNSHVPAIKFVVHALSVQSIIADSKFAKHACKNHTVSAENYLYLLVNNTWFDYC